MGDQYLFSSSSLLDQEFSYLEQLPIGNIPMETQTSSKIQDLSYAEHYEISRLAKAEEFTGKEAFKEPQYINHGACSKTQKLTNFLTKIVMKYEQEEKANRTKKVQNQQIMTQNEPQTFNQTFSVSNFGEEHNNNSNDSRTKKIKKEQYPTKNMLPSFKGSFLNYLSCFFPTHFFENIPIIKRLRKKFGISLQDYEDLFKEEIFKPHLKIYFRNKVIYRDLLQSRIEYKTKRVYFRKLNIFEQAFLSGQFRGIN